MSGEGHTGKWMRKGDKVTEVLEVYTENTSSGTYIKIQMKPGTLCKGLSVEGIIVTLLN